MEQELNKNGDRLDPMRFWRYVLRKDKRDVVPRIVIYQKKILNEAILTFIRRHPEYDFIFDDIPYFEAPQNVLFRFTNRIDYKFWVEHWNRVDFLLCDEEEDLYWKTAGLCGVRALHTPNSLLNIDIHKLDSIERIDNWENVKNLLTN